MPANHTAQVLEQKHFGANHQVFSVFASYHAEGQVAADAQKLAALIGPGVVEHFPHSGESRLQREEIYVPSQTELEQIEPEASGQPTYEIVGGWVNRQQAPAILAKTLAEMALPGSAVVEFPDAPMARAA